MIRWGDWLVYFENAVAETVTVNGSHYCHMLTNFVGLNWIILFGKACDLLQET